MQTNGVQVPATKTCITCQVEKPVEDFYRVHKDSEHRGAPRPAAPAKPRTIAEVAKKAAKRAKKPASAPAADPVSAALQTLKQGLLDKAQGLTKAIDAIDALGALLKG